MLRLKFTIFILFFWGVNNLQAQGEEEVIPYVEPTGKSNWFVEFGGAALLWSANYEKYLYRNYNHSFTWTGRIGVGYCPFEFRLLNSVYLYQNAFTMPFTSSIVLGKGKEKLEFGAGYTLATKNFIDRDVFPTAIAGFRVIDNNKALLKIAYTPFFRDEKFVNWFGVSLGRNF